MLAIKNNLMAESAARHLGRSYDSLAKSVERLSSGLRINSAKDDAAGLAVRELIRADIAALRQGSRNAADAVSMLQTAEGGLQMVDELLVRMRELAEQASTGSYSVAQRQIMDEEFQQLAAEITRIASNTKFNGNNLLETTTTGAFTISLGNGSSVSSQVIQINSHDCTAAGLGLGAGVGINEQYAVNGTTAYYVTNSSSGAYMKNVDAAAADLTVTIDDVDKNISIDAKAKEALAENAAGTHNVAAINSAYLNVVAGTAVSMTITVDGNAQTLDAAAATNMGLTDLATALGVAGGDITLQDLREAINNLFENQVGDNGASLTNIAKYWQNAGSAYGLKLEADTYADLDDFDITFDTGTVNWKTEAVAASFATATQGASGELTLAELVTAVNAAFLGQAGTTGTGTFGEVASVGTTASGGKYLVLTATNAYADLDTSFGVTSAGGEILFGNGAQIASSALAKVRDGAEPGSAGSVTSIATQDNASAAITGLNAAIGVKDTFRAHLGYMMNRLESAATVMDIQAENLLTAESRISDVDVATEVARMTRTQVLTQAGVSMLAQANTMPQMALTLLRG